MLQVNILNINCPEWKYNEGEGEGEGEGKKEGINVYKTHRLVNKGNNMQYTVEEGG